MMNLLKKIISYPVVLLSVIILGYLTITSVNSTVQLSEYDNVFFVTDNPVMHIIVFLFVILLLIMAKSVVSKRDIHISERTKGIAAIIILVAYTFILFILCHKWRLLPTFDQEKVFNIAANLVNHDYTAFLKGGYGEKWTNQWGYILLLSVIYKIFGIRNMMAINVLNILCMVATVYLIYLICRRFFEQNSLAILIFLCLFMPMWNYYSFVYGNIPAHFMCIVSLYLMISFFEKRRLWMGILSGAAISLAVILKTTVLIFFLAILIYAFMASLSSKFNHKETIANIAVILFCIIAYMAGGRMIHSHMENITGMELGNGVPRIAHIAMAMHESGTKTAGWYDGYIDRVYEEAGFDYALTSSLAKDDLNSSLQNFRSNPVGAIGFFTRKINSSWIEPTHEGIIIMLNRNVFDEKAALNVNILQTGNSGNIFKVICNYMQSLIYFGSLLFFIGLIRRVKDENFLSDCHNTLFMGIHFIGMFLFYLLWEANSQYTFFPVLLLIPYAVSGINSAGDELLTTIRNKSIPIKENILQLIVCCGILGILVVSRLIPEDNGIARMFYPAWNTDSYADYYSEIKNADMKMSEWIDTDKTVYADTVDNNGKAIFKAGHYLIYSDASDVTSNDISNTQGGCYLTESSTDYGFPVICDIKDDNRVILTSNSNGYIVRFQESQLVMDVSMGSTDAGTPVQTWAPNGDFSQYFQIEKAGIAGNYNEQDISGSDCYLIKYAGSLALTLKDDGSVTVENITGNKNQLWHITKAD